MSAVKITNLGDMIQDGDVVVQTNVTRAAAGAAATAYVLMLEGIGTEWRGAPANLLSTEVLFALSDEDLGELETNATGEEIHSPRSALAFFDQDEWCTWTQDEYHTATRWLLDELTEECASSENETTAVFYLNLRLRYEKNATDYAEQYKKSHYDD